MLAPFARFRLHFRYDTSLPKHSRDPAGVCLHIPSGRSYEDPLVKVGGMGRCVAWVRFCAPVLPIRSGVEGARTRAVKTLGGGRPPRCQSAGEYLAQSLSACLWRRVPSRRIDATHRSHC
jgi:hypothetical protein